MRIKNIVKEIGVYILCALIIWYIIHGLMYSKEIINEVYLSVLRCLEIIIPSLFVMMVLSELIIRTGIYRKLSVLFLPLSKFILRMPNPLFFVFLLGNVAGYPVGVKLLSQLCDSGVIEKKTAENMSVFCFGSGPAFVIGTVGVKLYSNVKAGAIIYVSCVLANLLFAVFFGIFTKYGFKKDKCRLNFSSEALVKSVESAGKSMFMICVMIIFFSGFLATLESLDLFRHIKSHEVAAVIKSLAEISNVTKLPSSISLLPVITFAISFGGLCVFIQLMAIVRNSFSLKKLFLTRIPVSLTASIINLLIFRLFPVAESCMTEFSFVHNDRKTSVFSSICLIFMIIIIFFQKKTGNSEKSVL